MSAIYITFSLSRAVLLWHQKTGLKMCCGLWLSTMAGMTLVWWLINHDLVKGEVDQAAEGVRKKRKNWGGGGGGVRTKRR